MNYVKARPVATFFTAVEHFGVLACPASAEEIDHISSAGGAAISHEGVEVRTPQPIALFLTVSNQDACDAATRAVQLLEQTSANSTECDTACMPFPDTFPDGPQGRSSGCWD